MTKKQTWNNSWDCIRLRTAALLTMRALKTKKGDDPRTHMEYQCGVLNVRYRPIAWKEILNKCNLWIRTMQTAESDIEDVHAHPCLRSVSTYANEREVKQYLNLLKASVPHLAKRMSRKRKKPTQKTKHALPNTKRRPAKRFPTGKFNSQADEKIQELKIKTSQYRRKLNNLGVPPGVANHLLRKAQSEAQQASPLQHIHTLHVEIQNCICALKTKFKELEEHYRNTVRDMGVPPAVAVDLLKNARETQQTAEPLQAIHLLHLEIKRTVIKYDGCTSSLVPQTPAGYNIRFPECSQDFNAAQALISFSSKALVDMELVKCNGAPCRNRIEFEFLQQQILLQRSRRSENWQPYKLLLCEQFVKVMISPNIQARGKYKKCLGLFALKDFKKGDFVCFYSGERTLNCVSGNSYQLELTNAYWNKVSGKDGEKRYTKPKKIYLNAVNRWNLSGRYINDFRGTGKSVNVKYELLKMHNYGTCMYWPLIRRSLIRVIATTDISNGEEFFVDYENVNAVPPVTHIKATGTKQSYSWQGKCGSERSQIPLEWDWVKLNCDAHVMRACVDTKLNTWQVFMKREGRTNPRAYWNGVSL